jgi:general secretion pathway protein D
MGGAHPRALLAAARVLILAFLAMLPMAAVPVESPPNAGAALSGQHFRLPLPLFIERVFGELLGLQIVLAPEIQRRGDTVDLRLEVAMAPEQLYRVAERMLQNFFDVGISIDNGVRVFAPRVGATRLEAPAFVDPLALGEQPDSAPVLVYIPLNVAGIERVSGWVTEEFAPQEVRIAEDPEGNALLVAGPAAAVEETLRLIRVLDRPMLRASESRLVELRIGDPQALAADLEQVLVAEGIDARRVTVGSAVVVLPLVTSRSLLLFATDRALLEHVAAWAALLDRESSHPDDESVFHHPLVHAAAEGVVETLQGLAGPARGLPRPDRSVPEGSGTQSEAPETPSQPAAEARAMRIAADPVRNMVVFRGSPRQWRTWLPAIRALDTPRPGVLVEVLVAELNLDDSYASGVEWLARESLGDYDITLGTLGGLGGGEQGFNLKLDDAGETRALLNLFQGSSRVTIRSRPRVVVASGESARLLVGAEIPVLASSSRSQASAGAPVVDSVEYRSTGLELQIRARVMDKARVELEVSQSFSQAQRTTTSAIDSPTILNRNIETVVNLADGGAVLLGGLIDARSGEDGRGVPPAGKLPVVGPLFRVDGARADRTELMVLVVPYVLPQPQDASGLGVPPP